MGRYVLHITVGISTLGISSALNTSEDDEVEEHMTST